jgi:hypothetical protein
MSKQKRLTAPAALARETSKRVEQEILIERDDEQRAKGISYMGAAAWKVFCRSSICTAESLRF